MKCTQVNCERTVKARGMCEMHYLRAYRANALPAGTRTDRVLEFIEHCLASDTDECVQPVFKPKSEYPSFTHNGVGVRIGWVVLERTKGPRPHPTYVMRHLCGISRCCNPRHLAWGTEVENMADKKAHGREYDRHGVKNPNAKLSPRDVAFIKSHARKGRGPYDPGNSAELAERFGVTKATIRMIARGATW